MLNYDWAPFVHFFFRRERYLRSNTSFVGRLFDEEKRYDEESTGKSDENVKEEAPAVPTGEHVTGKERRGSS